MRNELRKVGKHITGQRYPELDSLRGIAALVVAFYHLQRALSFPVRRFLTPLFSGPQAVVLFFVLSGFVLSLPVWRKESTGSYGRYLLRRFFRIYLPFAVAVAFSAIGAYLLAFQHLPLGSWYYLTWQTAVTPGLIVNQLLLSTTPALNTAFWSLRYEVQMSIVFPVCIFAIRSAKTWMAVLGTFAIYAFAARQVTRHASDPFQCFETFQYGSMFLVGAQLAKHREYIRQRWERMTPVAKSALLAVATYFYCGLGSGLIMALHLRPVSEAITILSAAALILAAICAPPFRRLLHYGVPKYLGRISYSLYLVHSIILFTMLDLFYGRVSTIVLGGSYLCLALIAAHLFCVYIEEPSTRLGKRLANSGLQRVQGNHPNHVPSFSYWTPALAEDRCTDTYSSHVSPPD